MTVLSFDQLGLSEPIGRALHADHYHQPTPIQVQAIPSLLGGSDLLAIAQTGTGKTAAFTLPILQRLAADGAQPAAKGAGALILAPTRELAIQIGDSVGRYGRHLRLRHAVVVGGVGYQPQIQALRRGVHVLVATTGRLLDHMTAGHVRLDGVTMLVLDEADRMLDMGFVRDVRAIIARLPERRQSALFSATMPQGVAALAAEILCDPKRIDISPKAVTAERVAQSVVFVDRARKNQLLAGLLGDPACARAMVFTRTKRGADRVARQLGKAGIAVEALHGDKSQSARQRALARFSAGQVRVLVATDIAARGIDIDDVTHVINYDLPHEPESYVHRIGRTARRGTEGIAISLCDPAERPHLKAIETLTRRRLRVMETAESVADLPPEAHPAPNRRRRRRRRGNGAGYRQAA